MYVGGTQLHVEESPVGEDVIPAHAASQAGRVEHLLE